MEVDFVIEKGSKSLTAIEVKSGRIKNTKGSMEFLKRYPKAFCITVGIDECPLEKFLEKKVELFK